MRVNDTGQHGCMLILGTNGLIEWQVFGRPSRMIKPRVHTDVDTFTSHANELIGLLNHENFRVCTGFNQYEDETPTRGQAAVPAGVGIFSQMMISVDCASIEAIC